MKFSLRGIIGLVLVLAMALMVMSGCSQKDDIVKGTESTTITLRPNNLPVLQDIYIYELWAAKIDGGDSAFVSLGRFVWDRELFIFRDTLGQAITNEYTLPETWLYYTNIYISIENRGVASPTPSGTFVLATSVGPVNDINPTFNMEFPTSMSSAIGAWFVGTPTDDTMNIFNEDKGIWLGTRPLTQRFLHDTLDIDSIDQFILALDTPYTASDSASWLLRDTIWAQFPITEVDTVQVVFGLDTLPHRHINVNWIDTLDSFNNYQLIVHYDIDSISSDPSEPRGLIEFYDYQPSLSGLPDVRPFGWRYNVWVLGEYFPSAANLSQMVPFAYDLPGLNTGDTTFQVISLGAFYHADSADLSNPYISNREVPNFPGEDFISGALPIDFDDSLTFVYGGDDSTGGIWGSLVIGLEPDPANLTIDSTRNFPLFFLSGQLSGPGQETDKFFHNWSQFLPKVTLTVKFGE